MTSKRGPGDRRTTLIHGQFIRQDQLDACKELGSTPSLFPIHTFYWGDWYDQIAGQTPSLQDVAGKLMDQQGAIVIPGRIAPIMALKEQFVKGLQYTEDYYHRNGITV